VLTSSNNNYEFKPCGCYACVLQVENLTLDHRVYSVLYPITVAFLDVSLKSTLETHPSHYHNLTFQLHNILDMFQDAATHRIAIIHYILL